MMLKNRIEQSYLFFVIFLILSCGQASRENTIPDVSHIEIKAVEIHRFDQELQQLNAANALELHKKWKVEYPSFYPDYITKILGIGQVDQDAVIVSLLTEIASNPDFKELANQINLIYPNLNQQELQLNDAFRRVKYYLPDETIPANFISFFSGFAVQVPIGEDYMGIGLDLFLGAESPFYGSLIGTVPRYLSRRFTPENITPRLIENFIREEVLPKQEHQVSMLNHMIHEGKALYLMDILLPGVNDSLKIGYTEKQLAWATHFESQVWDFFIEEELLFENDYKEIQQYFHEAPFTAELGSRNESAPKLGSYIGWQIVRAYMQKSPETTIPELISISDGSVLLSTSQYQGR